MIELDQQERQRRITLVNEQGDRLKKDLEVATKPKPKSKWLDIVTTILASLIAIATLSLLLAFPVKWLVNGLFVPNAINAVFGVMALSVWQAWGLLLLFGLLFGSKQSK
jgi:hypothetical protein